MTTPPPTSETVPTSLFQLGACTLPSGKVTHFKIECDILTPADWAALARLAVEILPPFSRVEGVPRGGQAFAEALEPYVTDTHVTLIADDVWVSGKSMENYRSAYLPGRDVRGIVAFNRGTLAPWVRSLINLAPDVDDATYRLDRPIDWWKGLT